MGYRFQEREIDRESKMSNLSDAEACVHSVEDENAKRAIEALIAECKRLATHIDSAYDQIDELKRQLRIR